jgi:hypothetical protein
MRVNKSDFLKRLGKSLEAKIFAKGYLTVEQFAHEHGLSKSTLYHVIKGEINTSVFNLQQYAEALEIPLSEIVKGV